MEPISYQYQSHILQEQAEAEQQFLQLFHEGNYTFENPLVQQNPYHITPLTALILFRSEKPSSVTICVKGKEQAGDICFTFPNAKEHVIPVYGLYADYRNEIVLTLENGASKTIFIQTEAAPDCIKKPEYIKTTPAYFGDQVMMLTPSSSSKIAAFDYAGDLRWYISLKVTLEPKRLQNGRFLVATERLITFPYYVTGLYEMSLIGKIYHEYRLPGGVHHDYTEDTDGNLIILSEDFNRDTVEDLCVVLDRKTGDIIKQFDLKPILPASAANLPIRIFRQSKNSAAACAIT